MPNDTHWGAWDPGAAEIVGGEDIFATRDIQLLASGFRWTEGPTWVAETKSLYFSDTIDARIYRWTEEAGVELISSESGGHDGSNVPGFDEIFEPGSNGMALHGDSLVICQHPTRRVVRVKLSDLKPGTPFHANDFEVIAGRSPEDRSLNAPNDVIVAPNGDVYFTDPIYGFLKKQAKDLGYGYLNAETGEHPDQPYLDECCAKEGAGHTGVYRVRDGKVELVTKELDRPNGLALSQDGKLLWVANSHKQTPSWTAYAMADELPLQRSHALDPATLGDAELEAHATRPGLSDGFKVDAQERIWSSCPGGMVVLDTVKKAVVAKVKFNTNISNIMFGDGPDVFVTGLGHLWRLRRRVA